MLISIALILILGMFFGFVCKKIKLPYFLDLSLLDSAILGAVLAAVSPAVVVPRMVKLIEEKRGVKKGIPQLILAGALS